ncbi:MAG: Amuc_1099 family pilus-like system protein [Verrucomicrobiota bacterium]
MSWLSQNYEKTALGAAGVLAFGMLFLGWRDYGAVDTDFSKNLAGTGKDQTAVQGAELIDKARQSLTLNRTWSREDVQGRQVDLFTGIPLFIARDAPDEPIDPETGDPIHPPIPNAWWTEHHIDPGFADSPVRDPDEDGFSNIEEFRGKTDPNSKRSFPALIAKLKYVKDESLTWVVRPGFGSGGNFPFKYEDNKGGANTSPIGEDIKPGGLFFAKEPQMNRFKLVGSETRKELNPRTNYEREVTIVIIEDQRPNKKGVKYEFPSPLQGDDRKNHYLQHDRTAILTLEALALSGNQFSIEENTKFALPPDAAEKTHLLKKITPESITVEYPAPDGTRKTVEIRKGSLPTMPE